LNARLTAVLATIALFLVGSLTGFAATVMIPSVSNSVTLLLEARMRGPTRIAGEWGGNLAIVTLVFSNNSVPVLLAFLYPFAIAKIPWNPPMSHTTRKRFLTAFSLLAAFLLGFFNLGSVLGVSMRLGGTALVSVLLSRAWLHGPIEFGLVILALSESLYLSVQKGVRNLVGAMSNDARLFVVCFIGLAISALIEVFLGA